MHLMTSTKKTISALEMQKNNQVINTMSAFGR